MPIELQSLQRRSGAFGAQTVGLPVEGGVLADPGRLNLDWTDIIGRRLRLAAYLKSIEDIERRRSMTESSGDPAVDSVRRRFVLTAGAVALLGTLEIPFCRVAISANYAGTIAALRRGVATEKNAHSRYVKFGRHAKDEGYKGLAYLYTALATSELIHSQNYARVLATLGELVGKQETREIPLGTAKENLIYAAESELNSIENTYPELLKSVEAEGHSDAITVIQYSWASHKQHLDIIEKIRRWSPSFFESVARKIDDKTDRYFVCQVCGSTVIEIPGDVCPVCEEPASKYRLIPHDRFF